MATLSPPKTSEKTSHLLQDLSYKWGLTYEPSPILGCPQLRGVYMSHHVLFQVWPAIGNGSPVERKRLIVSLAVPFEGMIRICRKNGVSHVDVLGMKPLEIDGPDFDSAFVVSTTHQALTTDLLTEEIRDALCQMQVTEVCISSNQVRIYGESDECDQEELTRWLETAIRIDGQLSSLLTGSPTAA